jgi:SnoaL-like domain
VNDTVAVTQLVLRERQARDRGWWSEMERAFWPGSRVTLTWFSGDGPGFVAASAEMAGRGLASVHRLSPPVVRVSGDRAWAEAPATIEARVAVGGVPADLVSATRLNYRVERRGSRWGIIALDAIYERDSFTAVTPGAAVAVPAAELAAFRPSYALLAWYLSQNGYPIGPDLLGDDQPAPRDEFYRQTWAWLAG